MALFYVKRDRPRAYGPSYLLISGGRVSWVDAGDYDTWDEAKNAASAVTEEAATLFCVFFRMTDTASEFEFDLESA